MLGPELETLLHKYLATSLKKGAPSTFADAKNLYELPHCGDEIKRTAQKLVESYVQKLRKNEPLEAGAEPCEPTVILWCLLFLAKHYDHGANRDSNKALELIQEAITHTPTLVELHMTKAKILKAGRRPLAVISADYGLPNTTLAFWPA